LFLSKQNIVFYFTNGQLKTGKTGTQLYAEHSRVSIPCRGPYEVKNAHRETQTHAGKVKYAHLEILMHAGQ
jgi:hypothetical protein